ncbi:DNA-processing protein DprA [Mycetocola spongiae]|nr:DNA-processing protein DprA [Mycetocola spongiae]
MLLLSLGAPTALRAVLNEWPAARTASLIREQGVEGIDPEGLIRVLEQAEARWRPRIAAQPVFRALEAARRSGVRLLLPQDPEWPVGVDDLGHHAPVALWARGGAGALAAAEHSVSLVGARASTRYGEEVTMEITAGLVERGFSIVSGAAYGIDGIAHRACLANHGHTIAVLAGGVDRPYPSGHAHLISRIAREGLIISEIPCGGAPTKWRFLQRNRLIAALGQATIVLEAGWRSGSLNTAAHAATLGRPLGAVPGPVTSATSAGCHRLLREYAAQVVIDADTAAELIAPLNHLPGGAAGAAATPPGSSAAGERPAPPAAPTQPRRAHPAPTERQRGEPAAERTERQRGEPAPERITSRPRYPDSRHPPGRRIVPERSPGRGVSSPARERCAPGPGVRGGLASERGFTAPPRPGAGAPPRGSSLPGVGAPSRGSSLPGAGAPSRGNSLPAEAEDMALTSAPAPQDAPDSLAAEPLFELPPEPIPTDYSGFNLSGEGPDASGARDTARRGNIRGAPGDVTPAAGGARATSRGAPEETRDAPLRGPGAGRRGRPTREGRRGAPPFGADGEPLRDTEELRRMRDALSYRQAKSVTMLAAEAGLSLHTARAALGLLALYGEAADNGEGWRLLRGRAAG